jgi:PEP-CTERM motif-containing protein
MFKSRLANFATFTLGLALAWFLCPRPAIADSILPISFSGTVGDCSSASPGTCSSIPSVSTVTGTYSIVPGTFPATFAFITGLWEFSTPFGSISSSMSGSSAVLITPYPFSTAPPNPLGNFPVVQFSADNIFISLTFNSRNQPFSEFGYGNLETQETTPSGRTVDPSTLTLESSLGPIATLDFTSGEAIPTPEPSSLLLMGTAMLGLVPFIRRRFGQS